jgi:hypothetical protein
MTKLYLNDDEDRHPYYDSPEKLKKQGHAAMICFWCIVGMIIMLILGSIWG